MSFKTKIFVFLILVLFKTPGHSASSCFELFFETKLESYQKTLNDIAGGQLSYIKFGVGLRKVNSLDDFAIARYGEKVGPEALEILRSQNAEALIIDAGIVLHLEEFKRFMSSYKSKVDVWVIRQNFSDYLGTRTVYRSMALSDNELKSVQTIGMISAKKRKNLVESDVDSVQAALAYHSAGFSGFSDFISVTDYPTLAIAVGKSFLKNEPNKNLYLFKIEVPRLDLIYFDNLYKYQEHPLAIRINLSKKPIDYHLESFAFGEIPAKYIKKVTLVSKPKQWLSHFNHIGSDDSVIVDLVNSLRNLFN